MSADQIKQVAAEIIESGQWPEHRFTMSDEDEVLILEEMLRQKREAMNKHSKEPE